MKRSLIEVAIAAALLAVVSFLAVRYCGAQGNLLYYGDAESHLAIARKVVDSRTPGYEQLGTVWLPLPHALMLPWVGNDWLWATGLAGAIPSAAAFVIGGIFLFLTARRLYDSSAAGWCGLAIFAANPNLLYLQSTPMTEAVLFACLFATLYFLVLYRDTLRISSAAVAGVACCAAALTRYEGWALIPCGVLFLLWAGKRRGLLAALAFGSVASLGPLYWLLHNRFLYSDAFAFYNGPYSSKAIYQHALDLGMARYPGDHQWLPAFQYFGTAGWLCAGSAACILGLLGMCAAFWKNPGSAPALLLLAVPPLFYVASMHGSGTPIFVPNLWPHSYYNTRYGLALLPLLAMSAGGLPLLSAPKWRPWVVLLIMAAAIASPITWICWKESEVNSKARRAWTFQAADYMKEHYRSGTGILSCSGDMIGIYREAGIPLRETLNDGNGAAFLAAVTRPDLFLHEEWAVAQADDLVARAMVKTQAYELAKLIRVPGAAPIEIYRRK